MPKERPLPRPFEMPWGKGRIVEEAVCEGPYHEPAIQLLEYEKGGLAIRFCHYDHKGRFQRSPLMVGEELLPDLKRAIAKSPRLMKLLKKLV